MKRLVAIVAVDKDDFVKFIEGLASEMPLGETGYQFVNTVDGYAGRVFSDAFITDKAKENSTLSNILTKCLERCPAYVPRETLGESFGKEFELLNKSATMNTLEKAEKVANLKKQIEQLDVKIDGNKELLDHKPMKFGLEEKNAIQILQGANLYKDIQVF